MIEYEKRQKVIFEGPLGFLTNIVQMILSFFVT